MQITQKWPKFPEMSVEKGLVSENGLKDEFPRSSSGGVSADFKLE